MKQNNKPRADPVRLLERALEIADKTRMCQESVLWLEEQIDMVSLDFDALNAGEYDHLNFLEKEIAFFLSKSQTATISIFLISFHACI